MNLHILRFIALTGLCYSIATACSGGGEEKKKTTAGTGDSDSGADPGYITHDLDGNVIEKCFADYAEEMEKKENGEEIMICDCKGDDCNTRNSTGTVYEANRSGGAQDRGKLRLVYEDINKWRRETGVPALTKSSQMENIVQTAGWVRSHGDHTSQDRQIRRLSLYKRRWGAVLATTYQSRPAQIWKDYRYRTGHYNNLVNRVYTHVGCSAIKRGQYTNIWCSLLG